VFYLISTAGKSVGLHDVHPHTLRHSCGYYLADKGRIYARCRTTLGIATRGTRFTTRASRAVASTGCGRGSKCGPPRLRARAQPQQGE
jgi:hypothetical protein